VTPHQFEARVYYQDTDAGGIVYHSRYLDFGERARAEALRALGLPVPMLIDRHGLMFVVQRINLDYQAPARLDDIIRIETRVLAASGPRVTISQHFRRDSDSLAVLDVRLAVVRVADGRPARLPAGWAEILCG
jgi:acyl-CoA thioester hydrolase